jgi:Asp-tRNA(Asn)/Glu-tRNA(Gln) amidotransferase A subunit family amidase
MERPGNTNTVDRNAYLDSPLSIQVVGPRLQERKLWDALPVIENAIKGSARTAKL